MSLLWRHGLSLLLLVFLALFLLLPLYTVLAAGLHWDYLLEVARNPLYREGMGNALCIAVVVTLMTFALAVPLAVVADRYDFAGKGLVQALVLLPMILPPFVGALGFAQIFGQMGALNSLLAALGLCAAGHGPDWLGRGRFLVVCITETLHLYPILYLNAAAALANVDPVLHEAADNLGSSAWRRFTRVTLPLIRPGLFAGGTLVFIWSFTELGTPLMLGYQRVTPVQIFNGITELETNPLPYTLVVVLLAAATGLYLLGRLVWGRAPSVGMSRAGSVTSARPLRGLAHWLPLLAFATVTGLAALPHLGVLLLAVARNWYGTVLPSSYTLQHFQQALSHTLVVPSILQSLEYALLAMVVCLAAGGAVAWLTVRTKVLGGPLLDLLAMLPLAVPGLILAFGYLAMASRYDWLRPVLDPVKNPTVLLVLAYAMRRLPYVTRMVAAGLEQTPVELELAAANLGAGTWRTLRKVVAPLIAANLIAAALFAFSFSMLEVSESLVLAQKQTFYPITRALYELAQILGSGPYLACAFGVWAMAFLAATVAAASMLLGKKMGAMFRL